VEVANEVVLADGILPHGPIKLVRFPRQRGQVLPVYRFRSV